ncbi:MAG TPA: hypothetical protein VEU33_07310 [Archangium sp.]|nr:hypothetical protein [Archangium sp.]
MSKWAGVVVAALSSLVMAACGPVDGTESPEMAVGQQEASLYVCGDGYCGGPENSSNCYQDCRSGC